MAKDFIVHLSLYTVFIVLVLGALIVSGSLVRATNTKSEPIMVYSVASSTPIATIPAYIVLDEATGEVLLAKDIDGPRPTASMIKLVVAAAAYQSDLLAATTTISTADLAAPEDFGKLQAGDVYTLRELLFPFLLESANDAGAAIERTWGRELSPQIDAVLEAAGVTGEVFVEDYNGLSAKTTATPAAMAKLLQHLARQTPTVIDITTLPQYIGHEPLMNNNPLASLPAYRGGKHGYTEEAGRTAALRYQATFADGERTLLVVLFGASDLATAISAIEDELRATVSRVAQTGTSSAIIPPN